MATVQKGFISKFVNTATVKIVIMVPTTKILSVPYLSVKRPIRGEKTKVETPAIPYSKGRSPRPTPRLLVQKAELKVIKITSPATKSVLLKNTIR